jgi:predicted AlkP superfamily phosphohydrolase/phosphomutase
VIHDLQGRLKDMVDPLTGHPVVRTVHRAADICSGPFLSQAPDLVIEWTDYAYWGRPGSPSLAGDVFEAIDAFDYSSQPLTGSHRPDGLLILSCGLPASTTGSHHPHVWDVGPTILGLLRVPVPRDLDGRPLCQACTQEEDSQETSSIAVPAVPEATNTQGYSREEEEAITEHLRSLGYL